MVAEEKKEEIRLDLGCGPKVRQREGFAGVDIIDFGQKYVLDLKTHPWPWEDNSVREVYSGHYVEHLTGEERIPFFNELFRVMVPKGTAIIVTPNWSHCSAYGDPTHKWPPMSPWYPLYLNKEWRDAQAPHVPYTCNFDWSLAGSWDGRLDVRNESFRQWAMNNYIDNWRELIVTLTKVGPSVKEVV